MAAEWIPCGSGFIEADAIRWKEAAWEKRRRRRGRAVNAGDRMVVAEVIRDYKDGWVELLVRASTVVFEKKGWLLKPLLANVTVRRRRRTIERSSPERRRDQARVREGARLQNESLDGGVYARHV